MITAVSRKVVGKGARDNPFLEVAVYFLLVLHFFTFFLGRKTRTLSKLVACKQTVYFEIARVSYESWLARELIVD